MVAVLVLITSWITPTSLFVFLNLVIGTIAISHRFNSHNNAPPQPEYPPLYRASSLLQRVRSIDFSSYKFPSTTADTQMETTPDQPDRPQLERAPSLLERVKSLNLSAIIYRSESETEVASEPDPDETDTGSEHHVERSTSEHVAAPEKQYSTKKMKKWASEKGVVFEESSESVENRRPATMRLERAASSDDDEVDAKADDFINKFKQQLKLQRLDSLIRYKELLKGKFN